MRNRWAWLSVLAAAVVVAGCERPTPPAPNTTPPSTRKVLRIKSLAQLSPNRAAHVAVDTLGNTYYTVETERGQDGVLVVGDSGIPRATQLTSSNILAAMGESVGGSGTIQDIAAGPAGGIWFYFAGGKGPYVRACVGQFFIRSESIRIIFDTNRLQQSSGMGESIILARGNLVSTDQQVHLLLRHLDAWSLFQFDNVPVRPGTELPLGKPWAKIMIEELEANLSQERYRLSAGPDRSLLLTDGSTGEVWQLDGAGRGKVLALLTGLPKEISAPVVGKDNRLVLFAADSEPMEADFTVLLNRRLPTTAYPALLEIAGEQITALGRDHFRAYGGFPVYAMRIRELVPRADDSWVAYDLASGQLMRLSVESE